MSIDLVFDHQIFSMQKFGGVSRYFSELINWISQFPDIKTRVLSPVFVNAYLRSMNNANADVSGYYIPRPPNSARLIRNLNAPLVAGLMHIRPPQIVHETYYFPFKLAPRRTCTVITVHDMIHERFPKQFSPFDPTRKNKSRAIKRADHIICVSKNTRNDLLETFDLEPSKVSVTHLASSLNRKKQTPFSLSRPFLLFVGQRSGYKNFSNLLTGFSRSPWLRGNFALVCFGGGACTASEHSLIRRSGLRVDQVLFLSGDDCSLAGTYAGASALVYPSLYEGFGIPIVEAMGLGCPVACADASSLPEIAGDAAVYFDPNDSESITETLESLLGSSKRLKTLSDSGRIRAKDFSWERCAMETCGVYRSLL